MDALVIDCNLAWAQQARPVRRTVVLVHTAPGLYLPVWQPVLDAAGLPPAAATWSAADLVLVASLERFDREPPFAAVYVGPVESTRPAGAIDWPADRPLAWSATAPQRRHEPSGGRDLPQRPRDDDGSANARRPARCIPGLGRDQRSIAARVAELGLGIALPEAAYAECIRSAVSRVLGDASYRARARAFVPEADRAGGAVCAAAAIEALLPR